MLSLTQLRLKIFKHKHSNSGPGQLCAPNTYSNQGAESCTSCHGEKFSKKGSPECIECDFADETVRTLRRSRTRNFDCVYFDRHCFCFVRSVTFILDITHTCHYKTLFPYHSLTMQLEQRTQVRSVPQVQKETEREIKNKLMFDLRSQRQLVKAKQNDIRLLTSAWKLNPNEIHLEEKIASGAFGEVWRGALPGRWVVAIKMMRPDVGSQKIVQLQKARFAKQVSKSHSVQESLQRVSIRTMR